MLPSLGWSDGWSAEGSAALALKAAAASREPRSVALARALRESQSNRARWFETVLARARAGLGLSGGSGSDHSSDDGGRDGGSDGECAGAGAVAGTSSGGGGGVRGCGTRRTSARSSARRARRLYSAMPLPARAPCSGTTVLALALHGRAVAMSLERYWAQLPPGIDPAAPEAFLPPARAERKRQQVANMARLAAPLIRGDGDVIVEFCAGSGSLALPLAACFPRCRFVLIDAKRRSLGVARRRLRASGLANVELREGFVEHFAGEPFDLGLALHACGEASDVSLELCLAAGAAYVMAPCCVGKVGGGGVRGSAEAAAEVAAAELAVAAAEEENEDEAAGSSADAAWSDAAAAELAGAGAGAGAAGAATAAAPVPPGSALVYPRSEAFRRALVLEEYVALAKAADFGHGTDCGSSSGGSSGGSSGAARAGAQSARHRKRRLCKSLVEHDRNLRAAERGYEVRLVVMQPPSATPKNDVLVGWKATATTPSRLAPGGAHALESWISVEVATGCAWADRDGDDVGA
jgi:hypothetical protein